MSTPSLAPTHSLSTVSRAAAARVAAAVAAVAVVLVLLALGAGTSQSSLPSAANATPVKSITPAGADMEQGFGTLNYRHSFVGHR
jgi:hypothetical protein